MITILTILSPGLRLSPLWVLPQNPALMPRKPRRSFPSSPSLPCSVDCCARSPLVCSSGQLLGAIQNQGRFAAHLPPPVSCLVRDSFEGGLVIAFVDKESLRGSKSSSPSSSGGALAISAWYAANDLGEMTICQQGGLRLRYSHEFKVSSDVLC